MSTDFSNNPKYEITLECVWWGTRYCRWMDGLMDVMKLVVAVYFASSKDFLQPRLTVSGWLTVQDMHSYTAVIVYRKMTPP